MLQTNSSSIRQMLLDAGLRPSVHRAAVLKYLLTHRTHPTADEIYAHIAPKASSLSLTTIYNSLKALTDAGLAVAIDIAGEGSTRFDSTAFKPHSHFACRCCGALIDIDLLPSLPPLPGAVVESAVTLFRGVCPACATATQQSRQSIHSH